MGYKTGMLVAVAVFCSSATADETIVNQATKVKSALETLNNLAHDCEMHFQIEEAPAKKSEACKEYLNAQRTHVPFLEEECSSLSKWYESMRQIVLAGAHLMDPVEADQLVTLMQVVRGTCGPETLDKHQLMTKRLSGLE